MSKDSVDSARIVDSAIASAIETIRSLGVLEAQIVYAADLIKECFSTGHKLLACGNGGSAADAADFTAEFACRFIDDRPPYPALNLSHGGSLLTATGNDYGFDEIFARQIQAFGSAGDALVTISTSGKSANIRRALEEGKSRGLKTIAVLGRDGGTCRSLADIELVVAGDSTARIQEAHKFLLHVICEIVEPRLKDQTRSFFDDEGPVVESFRS